MNFKEFVDLTRPVIGGKGGIQKYVRTLFDAILTEDGSDILEDYSDSSFKSYGNGNVQITEIAKAMSPHLDLVEFAPSYSKPESRLNCNCAKGSAHTYRISTPAMLEMRSQVCLQTLFGRLPEQKEKAQHHPKMMPSL